MTQNISNSFKVIDSNKIQSKSLNELYVLYGGEYIPVNKLEIITKSEEVSGFLSITESRAIRNVDDLKRNMSKLCLQESDLYVEKFVNPKFYFKGFNVPSTYESISIDKTGATEAEKIPYGLKRTLTTEAQTPSRDENAYLYVQIGDDWKFVRQGNVFYYEGTEKKSYIDALNEGKDITTLQLFDADNKEISSVYTEYEYKFTTIIKKEVVDLDKGTKSTVSIAEDGSETTEKTEKISSVYSQQSFENVEVDDETKPGKKKKVSKVKVTNYNSVAVDETNKNDSNWYVALTVKDSLNPNIVMAKLSDIVDENGNPIPDLSFMYGRKVKIKNNDIVVATSEPLTYEQANLRYDTIKTYQEIDDLPSEETCLRLANGAYVKELESVQPMSFKVAADDATVFNKYLVQQTKTDGSKVYVVVDKDYFEKHSSSKGLDPSTAKKLVGCDYNDASCAVIQTTSKEADVEQCSIIKEIPGVDVELQDKTDCYKAFKSAYSEGEYLIDSVYIDGVAHKVENGRKRYEYSDTTYHTDYADNLHEYRSLRTSNIEVYDGKIKGGAKFHVGDGIADSYSVWWKALLAGVTVVPLAGIFAPVLIPFVSVYGVAVLAAAPLIPLVNLGIGLVKNGTLSRTIKNITKYTDKTKYNRKQEVKNLNKEIASLYQIQEGLNANQFEDAYSKLMNNIVILSATTSNNAFEVKNGVGEVNPNNANLANEYVDKYNFIKSRVDYYSNRIAKLKARGKAVPASVQAEYDNLLAQQENIKNTVLGTSYGVDSNYEQLRINAASLKFYYNITHLTGDDLNSFLNEVGLTESFNVSRIAYDIKLGLTLDGVSMFANDKQLKKAFGDDGATIEAWKNIKEMLMIAINKVADPELKKPTDVGVEDISLALNELEVLYNELVAEQSFTLEISDEYVIKAECNTKKLDLQTAIDNLYTEAKSLISVEEIRTKTDSMKAKREAIAELKSEFEEIAVNVKSIEALIEQCNALFSDIQVRFDSMTTKDKDPFSVEFNNLKKNVGKVDRTIKSTKKLEDIKSQNEAMKEIVNSATEMINSINSKTIEADKLILIEKIVEYHTLSTERIHTLNSTKVKTMLTNYVEILNKDKNLIKEYEKQALKKETTLEDSVVLRNKSQLLFILIDIGVKSAMVLEELIKRNASVESRSAVGKLLAEVTELIKVDSNTSVDDLKLKLAQTKLKYENEILMYKPKEKKTPTTEKKEKKSNPVEFDTKINSEDELVVILKSRAESKDRKKLIEYINSKSGVNITEADIQATIERINEKHLEGKNATSNATRLKNKNILTVLTYGQQYLTIYAKEIKERTMSHGA